MREIQPLLAWVRRGIDGDLSLAALARRAARSPFDLHRRFAHTVGETPKAYIQRLRLARAAAALVAGRARILDVALDCGFGSHEVFIRAFRRQYGMTPRAYRDRGVTGDVARHAALVEAVAPCIGLVGLSLEVAQPRRMQMSHEISRQQRPAHLTLCARRRIAQHEIAAALGEILPRVFAYAQRAGVGFAGPPFARYLEWGPGRILLEAGMPVAAEAPGEGDIVPGALPGGDVAVTIHSGPYDTLREAHLAIEAWLDAQGLVAAGGPWESYVTDPADHPDPRDWKTEVVWPIRS